MPGNTPGEPMIGIRLAFANQNVLHEHMEKQHIASLMRIKREADAAKFFASLSSPAVFPKRQESHYCMELEHPDLFKTLKLVEPISRSLSSFPFRTPYGKTPLTRSEFEKREAFVSHTIRSRTIDPKEVREELERMFRSWELFGFPKERR